jgi:hypothetical protein
MRHKEKELALTVYAKSEGVILQHTLLYIHLLSFHNSIASVTEKSSCHLEAHEKKDMGI